jgi:hypothetical protein
LLSVIVSPAAEYDTVSFGDCRAEMPKSISRRRRATAVAAATED